MHGSARVLGSEDGNMGDEQSQQGVGENGGGYVFDIPVFFFFSLGPVFS